MKNLKYLSSILLDKERMPWSKDLKKILESDSIELGSPYDEKSSFLLIKYKKRMDLHHGNDSPTFGLDDLVKQLSFLTENECLQVYPVKNNFFSGECIVKDDEIIGCAFIKRGNSYSKKGLWIDGQEIS